MKNKLVYKIYPELNLILEVCLGSPSLEDLINFKKQEIKDLQYKGNYNIIVNISEIKLDTKYDYNFSKYIELINEESKLLLNKRHTAIYTKSPEQVVFGTLLKKTIEDLPMRLKIVSTLNVALDWAMVSLEKESFIKDEINKLKLN